MDRSEGLTPREHLERLVDGAVWVVFIIAALLVHVVIELGFVLIIGFKSIFVNKREVK